MNTADPGTGEPVFCCYGCRLVHSITTGAAEHGSISPVILRLGLGIFLTMNLMVCSFCFYGAEAYGQTASAMSEGELALNQLFRVIMMVLAVGVAALLGPPIALAAWRDLRIGRIQASSLIFVGTSAAFALSISAIVRGADDLYLDSACMLLVLVTVGEYLEGLLKAKALTATVSRFADLPQNATVETENGDVERPLEEVQPGEIVRVVEGGLVPVDGFVARGSGRLDEQSLTGESVPRSVDGDARDRAWAGSMVIEGPLWIETQASGQRSRVAQMATLLQDLRSKPPAIQRIADRIASIFVPATLLLAVVVWVATATSLSDAGAATRALSIILIACPCALGLTAPLVVWTTSQRLASRGVIVRDGRALENAETAGVVAFDKTGTLTSGQFDVTRVETLVSDADNIAEIASGLEAAGTHPIARAIRTYARPMNVESAESIPGFGVTGIIDGVQYTLARPELKQYDVSHANPGEHVLVLWRTEEPIGIIRLEEAPRPGIDAVLGRLRERGLHLIVLTGDGSERARAFADKYNIEVINDLLPDEKVACIQDLRHEHRRPVAFVGDGLNDAAALMEADLGIALQSGSDLARASGDVILVGDDIDSVPLVFEASRAAGRRIRYALGWSFSYNTVGLVLASLGFLTPIFAAISMFASSTVVILLATRRSAWLHGEESHESKPQSSESITAVDSSGTRAVARVGVGAS